MDPIDGLLQQLLATLGSERVLLYAPARCADIVCPPASGADARPIDALTRRVLWPVAQYLREAQVPTRSWLERGGPVLPYRAIVCALQSGGRVIGFVAGLRRADAVAYTADDTAVLAEAAPRLSKLLDARQEPTSFLRRPDLEAEIARRPSGVTATAITQSEWPSRVRREYPLSISHTRSALSSEAEIARRPSGVTARAFTPLEWPSKIRSSGPPGGVRFGCSGRSQGSPRHCSIRARKH